MSCKKFEKKLVDLINKELNKKEEEQILKHLEKCERCKNKYDELKMVIEKSKKIDIPVLPSSWWDSRENSIFEVPVKEKRHIFKRRFVFALISIIFVFSLSLFFFKSPKQSIVKNEENNKYSFYYDVLFLQDNLSLNENEILQMVDYLEEDEAEKILDSLLK
ncbi:MAG TPA: zf-HC2 domain-containing protein [Candidatus Ratteibacteria bacterium]|nr:zf-HC2 domain-containing protein [bacterium]HRR95753.1 zf-HC2 domain-containing protein [Candidatus Ratteibacteria bacterium]